MFLHGVGSPLGALVFKDTWSLSQSPLAQGERPSASRWRAGWHVFLPQGHALIEWNGGSLSISVSLALLSDLVS